MATTIQSLKIKSQDEIRDDYLRTYRNGLIKRGIADPTVSEGTEIYLRATALAQQIYAATNNVPLAANAQMPDAAQGDDLVRVSAVYKLALRPAGASSGPLVLSATISTPIAIPGGSQLIDLSGLTYAVAIGGSYSNGGNIPIISIDTGAATNLTEGTTLRWVSPPPFVNTTAAIGTGGLTGGVNAETFEELRSRLLDRLQNPPNGVNCASVNKAAEDASTAVQKSFCYPAANGPSTLHYAVVRTPTATNKNRDVDALVVTGTIVPAVLAEFPEFVEVIGSTVQNYPVDISIGLSLPAAATAVPAGPGGGWSDGQPFPTNISQGYASVSGVTSSTVFTLTTDNLPSSGQQVCWLSANDWTLYSAKILSFTSSGSGPYSVTLTIDTPFVSVNGVSIAVGDYVFPSAENMATYIKAILEGLGKMGPYEKTNSPGLLPRALRRPLASSSWPSELKKPFLRNLSDAGEEVFDVQYLYQSAVTPPLPASITNGPYIFVPRRIGVYPI